MHRAASGVSHCAEIYRGLHNCSIRNNRGMAMQKTKTEKKISKVYKEFQAGKLHSGKGGPIVKSKAQGLAIALSSAGVKQKKAKK